MVQWFSLEAIGTRYMSTCLVPRPDRRRKEGLVSTASACATIKICTHKREGTNNVLVLRWSGLWRFLLVFQLPHLPSVRSCKMTVKLPQPHHHQQHTSPTYFQNKWKRLTEVYWLPKPNHLATIRKFTIADRCSGLSITWGVPTCWRTSNREGSTALVMQLSLKCKRTDYFNTEYLFWHHITQWSTVPVEFYCN